MVGGGGCGSRVNMGNESDVIMEVITKKVSIVMS